MKRRILLTAIVFLALFAIAWAATENQSSGTESGTNWGGTLSDIRTSDDNRVTYNNTAQDWLSLTNFGFTAVEGTIDSIRVNVEGFGGTGSPAGRDWDCQLLNAVSGTPDIITTRFTPNTDALFEVNGSTDVLWGATWDVASITSSSFGLQIRDADASARSLDFDFVEIYVHYTAAATGVGQIMIID